MEVIPLSLKNNNRRITAIITQEQEEKIRQLSDNEKRSKSSMTAILIEEAISARDIKKEVIQDD